MIYSSMLPSFVSADTEIELQKKLGELTLKHNNKIVVINVYPKGSKVYAWYFHDYDKAGKPQPEEKPKPRTRKKVVSE